MSLIEDYVSDALLDGGEKKKDRILSIQMKWMD